MDAVFKALADPTRQSLLDELFRQDGQTLSALEGRVAITPGSRYEFSGLDGTGVWGEGENLEVDPPRRLVQTYRALWSDEVKNAGFSRVTWEIEPVGDSCRMLVVHDELPEGASDEIYGGWPQILSGLKTLLKTGEQLTTPASLRFSGAAAG